MDARSSADSYERCGRVKQKGNWLGRWRDRFMTLEDGMLRLYSEHKASKLATSVDVGRPSTPDRSARSDIARGSPQSTARSSRGADREDCHPCQLGHYVLRRETMSVPISRIESAWAASSDRFNRPNCFIVLVRKDGTSGWQLGIQAPDSDAQQLWVQSLTLAISAMMKELQRSLAQAAACMAPQLTPSQALNCELPLANSEVVSEVISPSSSMPQQSTDNTNSKGKGLGKGKAAPPLPKAKPKAEANRVNPMPKQAPPLGKRLHVQPIDRAISLDGTVFSSMLSGSRGTSRASSCRGSSAAGSSHDSESVDSDQSSESSEDTDVVERLRETFSAPELSAETMRKRQMVLQRRQDKKKTIFDDRTAQNLDIVLRSLSIPVVDLAIALEDMDFSTSLSIEELERMRESMPPNDQLRRLLSYEGDISELRRVEQEIMKLARVNRFDARLRIMALEKGLKVRRQRLIDEAKCVRDACKEMSDSPLLRDILQAVLRMFNFINHGVEKLEKSSVRCFDITTAVEVAQFKASECFINNAGRTGQAIPKVNFTGLHFVVSRVLIRKPTATSRDFALELRSVHEAAGLTLRTIAGDVVQFSQETQFLEKEIDNYHQCYEALRSSEPHQKPIKPHCKLDKAPLRAVGPSMSEGASTQRPRGRVADFVIKAICLSPVREDISARHDLRTKPKSFVLGSPRRFREIFKDHIVSAARQLGVGPKVPLDASWLQEICGSCAGLCGLRRKWRCIVLKHHMLEVHRSMRVKAIALPDAIINPFSSTAASPESQALHEQCPYGFEIITSFPPVLLRFQCPSSAVLEHWLSVLRAEASVVGCGWLEIASPRTNEAADLQRMKFSRRWVMLKRKRELHLYRNPHLARKRPDRPLAILQIVGQHLVGFFNQSGIPDEVKAHGRKWLFNVVDSNWNYHYCSAPSADAFEKWFKSARRNSLALSTPRQLEDLFDQCTKQERPNTSPPESIHVATVKALTERTWAQDIQVPYEPTSATRIEMTSNSDFAEGVESQLRDASERQKPVALPPLDFRTVSGSSRSSQFEAGQIQADEPNWTSSKADLKPIQMVAERLEKVKEDALSAEKATREALKEACQQALLTMRYFGQVTPFALDADGQPEDIGKFADSLKSFLSAVDNFLQRVGSAWQDIELEREARLREGFEDLPMRTPREWSKSIVQTPRSARGGQTPRNTQGFQTPRTARCDHGGRFRRWSSGGIEPGSVDGMLTMTPRTPMASTREEGFVTPRVGNERGNGFRLATMTPRGPHAELDSDKAAEESETSQENHTENSLNRRRRVGIIHERFPM